MPLSAAEKQRRYRARRRLDKTREDANKEKDLQRYHSKKKLVHQMSKSMVKTKRNQWKMNKRSQRARKKDVENIVTPPSTPEMSSSSIGNKLRGRKKVARDRASCYRKLQKLENKNRELQKSNNKLKKRFQRMKAAKEKLQERRDLTPKSKINKLLSENRCKVPEAIRKKLIFHSSLMTAMAKKYSSLNNNNRALIRGMLSEGIFKQYKLLHLSGKYIGLSQQARQRKKAAVKDRCQKKLYVEDFYNRDDVSRATSGKKETVTYKKCKQQRRYLLDSIVNLHKKMVEEGGIGRYITYSTFAKWRPFYVLIPKITDRNTCACKLHSNLQYMADKLNEKKVMQTSDIHELVKQIACKTDNVQCMYNNCKVCKESEITTDVSGDILQEKVQWEQWVRKKEEREQIQSGRKSTYTVTVNKKELFKGSVAELLNIFQQQMRKKFKTHLFNIRQQYSAAKKCQETISSSEIILHIDFSENYACKLKEEIQSYHFGASRHQVSLHTVVVYTHGEKNPISLCTISPSTDHSPAAIWAHLNPIFNYIKQEFPNVKIIHFFSDGPSTQYRQKKNFYMFSNQIFALGFQGATWSYFEASHGKGAPDGVGAALKRKADDLIRKCDIPDAQTFFEALRTDTTVKLFFVPLSEIESMQKCIPDGLRIVPGTMKIHQLATLKPGIFYYRNVSCYCDLNRFPKKLCSCNFKMKSFSIISADTNRQQPKQKQKCPSSPFSSSESSDQESIIYAESGEECFEDLAISDLPENTKQNIQKGTFVLTEYPKFSNIFYVGKVLNINDNICNVDFMRKCSVSGKIERFIWPDLPDVTDISMNDIVHILDPPTPGRRDTFTFATSFATYNVK